MVSGQKSFELKSRLLLLYATIEVGVVKRPICGHSPTGVQIEKPPQQVQAVRVQVRLTPREGVHGEGLGEPGSPIQLPSERPGVGQAGEAGPSILGRPAQHLEDLVYLIELAASLYGGLLLEKFPEYTPDA